MIYGNIENTKFVAYLFLLVSDLIGYTYILLKVYRILCFSKITFDQLPFLNPYKWPLSLIRIITKPYFKFWSQILPNLRLGKVSYDVSSNYSYSLVVFQTDLLINNCVNICLLEHVLFKLLFLL